MSRWVPDNEVTLLENGEAYFPRVCDAIATARREVVIETFILFDDPVGQQLKTVLIEAAGRGVSVDLTIDGWGSAFLSPDFTGELIRAGVRLHVFDPGRTILTWRTNVFRRLHRKIVVIDGVRAFIGGINFGHDHVAEYGPQSKQDYAIEVSGPIVESMHRLVRDALAEARPRSGPVRRPGYPAWRSATMAGTGPGKAGEGNAGPSDGRPEDGVQDPPRPFGPALALFVTRDNDRHRTDIEQHYRTAFRLARTRIVIANAYFFPGYRFLRELVRAAQRGVTVDLILQGRPDLSLAKSAPEWIYGYLIRAGVRIHEYVDRPLHAKVAVVDDEWATVGSSNLDPLSLSLNLEANLMIRHEGFCRHLAARLDRLIAGSCRRVDRADGRALSPAPWRALRGFVVFHFLRHFPAWADHLPSQTPRIRTERGPCT